MKSVAKPTKKLLVSSNYKYILLTIDVEDWFQVENFKRWISADSWSALDLRVETNIQRLLDLLDSLQLAQSAGHPQPGTQVKATFFILGWVAERLPHLVREIRERGHEVASHGYHHNLCTGQSSEELKKDLMSSKKCLEDITGDRIQGFRAPSFAVDDSVLKNIEDCGYRYDSSYNSFAMHGRYGKLNIVQNGHPGIAIPLSGQEPGNHQSIRLRRNNHRFYELPISNLKFYRRVLPWGGGAYFRLLPLPLFKMGVARILENSAAFLFYFHPWEIDPSQPKVDKAFWNFRFRHYTNLSHSYAKLFYFLTSFKGCRFVTCRDYLNAIS